jgi:energy-coupling factor transporter ATP-binding protein EcfA2
MQIRSYTRDVFLHQVWKYEAGEHVSVLAPTGGGKTHLINQLLQVTAREDLQALSLVMKPRDQTAKRFAKASKHRVVRSWPINPASEFWRPKKPPGYVLWPRHTFDPDVDDWQHKAVFRRAILDSYKKGKRILFADEVFSLARELRLERELVTVWTKGRSMECGLWGATQRPWGAPQQMYSQAEHVFISYSPDTRDHDRYGEIGGVDPKLVADAVKLLPRYWWLYIRRSDRVMCVIQK